MTGLRLFHFLSYPPNRLFFKKRVEQKTAHTSNVYFELFFSFIFVETKLLG